MNLAYVRPLRQSPPHFTYHRGEGGAHREPATNAELTITGKSVFPSCVRCAGDSITVLVGFEIIRQLSLAIVGYSWPRQTLVEPTPSEIQITAWASFRWRRRRRYAGS